MGFLRGVNLPYFFDAYGRDLAPNALLAAGPFEVDPMAVYRPLLEAREIGFEAVRVWLCEGGEGLLMKDGEVSGIHPVLVESVAILQECAHLCGLKLYWTLLDGHSWRRMNDSFTRSILADPHHAARFAERVVTPLARRLEPKVTFAVEIVNAPEALTAEGAGEPRADAISWDVLGMAIRTLGGAVRAEHGAILVSAGTSRRLLPLLWRSGAGVSAIDVHVGNPHGGIPSREELATALQDQRVRDRSIPLVAGCECVPEDLESTAASVPLHELASTAEREGYAAAFLGRLDGDYIDTTTPERSFTTTAREMQTRRARLGSTRD
ncbi:MAG: hypothetical protein HY271_11320 [Deltaproteobacteria bacterium]|nr:hypothetical protein [Deltaproteobacteria bacterium]